MKTKITSFALIAAILGGCTMPNLPGASDKNYQSSTTTVLPSVSNALANTQAPKDFREQFESAKPRLQKSFYPIWHAIIGKKIINTWKSVKHHA